MTRSLADDKIRNAVVTDLVHNINVVAGAGTGKTSLLVGRIMHLIFSRHKADSIRHLVALTFTEKAANEMRSRIIHELEEITGNADEGKITYFRGLYGLKEGETEEIAQQALSDVHKAQICTIHSFCVNILKLYPLEAGVSPNFSIDEGGFFDSLFGRMWPAWLESELSADSRNRAKWKMVLKKFDLKHLKEIAEMMCNDTVPPDALISGNLKEELGVQTASFINSIRDIMPALKPYCSKSKSAKNLHDELAKTVEELDKCAAALPACLYKPSLQGCGRIPEECAPHKNLLKKIKDFAEGINKFLEKTDDELIKTVFGLLKDFCEKFRSEYTASGYVTFNKLLILARNLLRDNTDVRKALKKEYRAILVDEFQDTDPVQCEIVLYLSEEKDSCAKSTEKIRLEQGKLFLVGDPKQSIYLFRRADLEAYANVTRIVEQQNGKRMVLETNFRSHSGIIDTVNGLFEKIMVQQEYDPISAVREPELEMDKVQLVTVTNSRKEDLSANDARVIEAEWVAEWISTNLAKPIRDHDSKNSTTPLSCKHIAILLRALTNVEPYISAFKRHNIPYIVEGEKFFYTMQEVIDFANMLKAITDPSDDLAVAAFLKTPFAGLKDSEIYLLLKEGLADYRKDAVLPDSIERKSLVKEIFSLLASLHGQSRRMPPDEFLLYLFKHSFVLETAAGFYHGEHSLANIMKMYESARKNSFRAEMTLSRFVEFLDNAVTEQPEEGESPLADETFDAVRIFSIHKSKGLEFPVVILPNLHGTRPPQKGELLYYDWQTNSVCVNTKTVCNSCQVLLEKKREEKYDSEERRILYVAMTRPRERLIMLSSAGGRKCGEYMEMINSAVGIDFRKEMSGRYPAGKGIIEKENYDLDPDSVKHKTKNEDARKEKYDHEAYAEVWRKRQATFETAMAQPLFTSVTTISAEKRTESADNDAGSRQRTPDTPALAGIIIHRLLERHDFKNGPHELLKDTEKKDWPDIVASKLKKFVRSQEYKELASAEILGKEVPFTVRYEGRIVSGVIDLIYRLENGTVIVADYKTGSAGMEDMDETYKYQKEIYLKAVKDILKAKDARFKWITL